MIKETVLKQLLGRIRAGGFTLVDWRGQKTKYGPGRSEFTLTIHDPKVVGRLLANLSLGFGEAYMDGQIDVDGDLHDVVALANRNALAFQNTWRRLPAFRLVRGITRGAKVAEQQADIAHHYDVGNEFYRLWLDETMSYSCAYFEKPTDRLVTAQKAKTIYTLRKLQPAKGNRILDIGSGWGELIITAAQTYGMQATGITLSKEQLAKTNERIAAEKLEPLVDVKLLDYRELKGSSQFDRIVSVGMFEHVGRPNHAQFFEIVARLLKPGGIGVLHTITTDIERPTDPWIGKYIFPGAYIPSWREVVSQFPDHDLHLTDAESLRMHYARTLDHWAKNFETHLKKIRTMYDERFIRMWRLYLRSSAASFRTSGLDLHQFVFTKGLNNDQPLTRRYLYE